MLKACSSSQGRTAQEYNHRIPKPVPIVQAVQPLRSVQNVSDKARLTRELSGFADLRDFQRAHREWVEQGLENGLLKRDDRWSESIAVGGLSFVEEIKTELGIKALHREAEQIGEGYVLREQSERYPTKFAGENSALSSENTLFWNESVGSAGT